MMLLEQVAMIDAKFREMRRERGKVFGQRNARGIADLQRRGLADTSLDPYMAAMALNGMVGRLAYHNFALGDDMEFEALVETATKLWVNALKIKAEAAPATAADPGQSCWVRRATWSATQTGLSAPSRSKY